MTSPEDLWLDDTLGRKAEAELLEEVLLMEAAEALESGRDQSYVLGIDAAYGEGKTFFLTKFRQHLAANHPVAFVDAWADDSNDAPLLAIMAAINEALEPFLQRGGQAREKLKAVTTAALPILGKLAVGMATTFVKRHVGDEIADEVSGIIKDQSKPTAEEEVLVDAIGNAGNNITNLVDKAGAEMLATYKARKESKQTFKANMRALVSALPSNGQRIRRPLFVVIDELDRCRPDYAIKVLEEVKHLFDIAGVVFIIAIHGDQLEKSIAAVYGNEFNARAYLQRFYSRRYELRRLSMDELVATRVTVDDLEKYQWRYPQLLDARGTPVETKLSQCISAFCKDYKITPREFNFIADGLKLFSKSYQERIPIELIYSLHILLSFLRSENTNTELHYYNSTDLYEGTIRDGKFCKTTFNKISTGYIHASQKSLNEIISSNNRGFYTNFVFDSLEEEAITLHARQPPRLTFSLISQYPDRLARFGRLLE